MPESDIYGHQLFRNKSLEVYQATDASQTPETYPLQAGDELAVTIFGASQADLVLRVDEAGFVTLPNSYRVSVAGVSLAEARQLLAGRLKRYYNFRDGQLTIRINAAQTITVSIFGEVEQNGSYTLSSLNTAFNALVAAGGPTDRGTVRKIQLIQGQKTTVLDVYDYLNNPTEDQALFLSGRATVYVPVAEKLVTLAGGVRRPLRYELLETETLTDLLQFAGGTVAQAETANIRVTRYRSGRSQVINVDLGEQPDFLLADGDVITVPVVTEPVRDFVTVEGAVLLPGNYAYAEGTTVGDLIELGRPRPGAKRDVVFLFSIGDDGRRRLLRLDLDADPEAGATTLSRGDIVRILAGSDFTDEADFTVRGAVRDTSITLPFPKDGGLTLEEALLLAGGTTENATSEVMLIRTPTDNQLERRYERLSTTEDREFLLEPFDELVVYANEQFTDNDRTVSIEGAVRSPGAYVFDASLTMRDLIYLSGGLTVSASTDRIEVFRLVFVDGASTRTLVETVDLSDPTAGEFQLRVYDEVVVRDAAEYEAIQNVTLRGEVRYPGTYAILDNNEKLTDVIGRAGGLTEEAFPAGATMFRASQGIGNVVLDLEAAMQAVNAPANMVLLEGDTIFIPKQRDVVSIVLENTIAENLGRDSLVEAESLQVAYQGGHSAAWYVRRYAGGFNNETARRRWTTVQYANGQIKETASFAGLHNYPEIRPGATIRVRAKPEKIVRERREERFNWIGLAQVLAGVATTITTLIIINNR